MKIDNKWKTMYEKDPLCYFNTSDILFSAFFLSLSLYFLLSALPFSFLFLVTTLNCVLIVFLECFSPLDFLSDANIVVVEYSDACKLCRCCKLFIWKKLGFLLICFFSSRSLCVCVCICKFSIIFCCIWVRRKAEAYRL